MKNQPNRKKLLNSKWTAIDPKSKEKHFSITYVKVNDDDIQVIDHIILTAVLTGINYKMNYDDLKSELNWKQGWT
jgi:tryptophan-rich hypothetical protein